METTKLYVEYIVVGMETLAIIFLVIFIIIGNAFLPIIKYCIKNIVPSIIMLGWCYILGLIVDRIADIIYDKRKMHIKEKYPIVAETSIIVWEHFKQDAFATFTLSRIENIQIELVHCLDCIFGHSCFSVLDTKLLPPVFQTYTFRAVIEFHVNLQIFDKS